MTPEQTSTLIMADKTGMIKASCKAICDGLHFCPEWDYLPIFTGSPEWDACLCDIRPSDTIEGE